MQINSQDKEMDAVLLVASFMNNYSLMERDDRIELLKIIKYLTVPSYKVHNKAPIEEEWLAKTGYIEHYDGKSVLLP